MSTLGQAIDNHIERSLQSKLEEVVQPLQEEIADLKECLFEERQSITHKEACRFFGGRIKPQRVKDYIFGRKLPPNVDVPLPANKVGRQYFIDTDVLELWQLGRTTKSDLYQWQKERS